MCVCVGGGGGGGRTTRSSVLDKVVQMLSAVKNALQQLTLSSCVHVITCDITHHYIVSLFITNNCIHAIQHTVCIVCV